MTITLERPLVEDAPPIRNSRTWRVVTALEAFSAWIATVNYTDLPDLAGVDAKSYGDSRCAEAQIMAGYGPSRAGNVLAWRDGIPGARVSLTGCSLGTSNEHWRAVVHVPGGAVELWNHVDGVTEAHAARLERDPQTAYAVLVELAAGAR